MVETLNRISRVNRNLVNEMGLSRRRKLAQRRSAGEEGAADSRASRRPLSLETPIGRDFRARRLPRGQVGRLAQETL